MGASIYLKWGTPTELQGSLRQMTYNAMVTSVFLVSHFILVIVSI